MIRLSNILYIGVGLILSVLFFSCGNTPAETVRITFVSGADINSCTDISDYKYLADTASTVHRFKIRGLRKSLGAIFADRQDAHFSVFDTKGIHPINDLRSAYQNKLPICKVESCDEFTLDTLTHSLPYLEYDALQTLKDIGKSFSDSVEARSGHRYKVMVTSVLRTSGSIAKLRRRNRNAVENSAHQYGRTFDISYVNFTPSDPNYILSQECLKNLLGEILYDFRNRGLCYVKYERKQGCFHITAR